MALTVTIDLPPDVEQRIRAERTNLNVEATEAYLVDLYRRGILSHLHLARSLSLDRFQTDAFLQRHGVSLRLSESEVSEEMALLREVTLP